MSAVQSAAVSSLFSIPSLLRAGDRRLCRWTPQCLLVSACFPEPWGPASNQTLRNSWNPCWLWASGRSWWSSLVYSCPFFCFFVIVWKWHCFSSSSSPALTAVLHDLSRQIPQLKKDIQDGLLKMLSLVLMHKPLRHPGMPKGLAHQLASPSLTNIPEASDVGSITLALRTLGSFEFEGKKPIFNCDLLFLVTLLIVIYLLCFSCFK